MYKTNAPLSHITFFFSWFVMCFVTSPIFSIFVNAIFYAHINTWTH